MDTESKRKQKAPLIELIFISAVLTAGVALEIFTKGFDFSLISFPVNLILVLILILLGTIKGSSPLSAFGKTPVALILILLITLLSVAMGLIPGNSIKSSWPFALVYMMLMVSLSMAVGRRLRTLRQKVSGFFLKDTGGSLFKDTGFLLKGGGPLVKEAGFLFNHLGILLLLIATGLGRGDFKRYFITVPEEKVEWRGENAFTGEVEELPVAIQLNDFRMELYPSKIMIVNKTNDVIAGHGKIAENGGEIAENGQEEQERQKVQNSQKSYTLSEVNNTFNMGGWSVRVDSVTDRPGYAPAAFVTVKNSYSDTTLTGWISCGNYFQMSRQLAINDYLMVVMTPPDPKSYQSDVEVFTKKGVSKSGTVRVNHPVTAGSWKIYQYSYDTVMGRDSGYSVFELVYDPWVIVVYIGIVMLFLGAVTLFWKGGER
ncbi:MAG: cytochrome c biogenesis protein ResB [Bacteroidales bacterium]|nr:cytochrome c biogenesis protein ResB [Bacteroidales bacterium]MDD2425896.1 cytochrome c biogenesis protein ResB [Bacteroidales bacterium]MDD3990148.1 cytochrome c biogenesis protein ResB [Bacteroidales bacterium]MDD4639179.1 cytochrome c biogenesis protein ResB [Bacteroidales bacterium]